jgi:hypothetical protein
MVDSRVGWVDLRINPSDIGLFRSERLRQHSSTQPTIYIEL